MNAIWNLFVFGCLFLLTASPVAADGAAKLLYALDLQCFGYFSPVTDRDAHAFEFLNSPVVFLDRNSLAISFLTLTNGAGASSESVTAGTSAQFHTVIVDAASGRISQRQSWGNAGNVIAILPLTDVGFFVQAGDQVAILSNELQQLVSMKLTVPGDLLPRFAASPSGRSLFSFIDSYDDKNGWLTRFDLLDTSHLSAKQSMLTPGQRFATVSDTQVVYSLAMTSGPLRLMVQNVDDSSETGDLFVPNGVTARAIAESHCSMAAFLSDTTLAISGDCDSLFITHAGEILHELHARDYRFGTDIRPSHDGHRFALARSKGRIRSPQITNLELCVYDLSRHKFVFIVPVSPVPHVKLGFALSPDGGLLAIQRDNQLQVWKLPK